MSKIDWTGPLNEETTDFYTLAAAFVAETSTSDHPHRLLKLWAHRFPEHAADLAALAYARIVEPEYGSEEGLEAQRLEIINSARRVLGRVSPTKAPLTSLAAAAGSLGISPHQLADSLRIDIPLFAKLEQRLLEVTSVPATLISSLAAAIGRSVTDVSAYLSGPPRLATNAAYKSNQPPFVSEASRQTFQEALAASRSISPQDRDYWTQEIMKLGE